MCPLPPPRSKSLQCPPTAPVSGAATARLAPGSLGPPRVFPFPHLLILNNTRESRPCPSFLPVQAYQTHMRLLSTSVDYCRSHPEHCRRRRYHSRAPSSPLHPGLT